MGLLTNYEKSWQFDMNREKADAVTTLDCSQYFLYYLVSFITGAIGGATKGLWQVYSSCDSANYGNGDLVNRWTSPSAIIYANAGVAHSWVVLRRRLDRPLDTSRYVYFVIDFSTNAYTTKSFIAYKAPTTAGSLTAAPTWASSSDYLGPYTTNAQNTAPSTNPGPIHVHGQLATDGSFNVFWSRDNTGRFGACFIMHRLANTKPDDACPWLMSFIGEAALTSGYGAGNGLDAPTLNAMRNPLDSGPPAGTSTGWGAAWLGGASADNVPSGGQDAFGGGFYDFPVFIGSGVAAYRGVRGRLQDILFFAGGALTGTVDSTPGAPQYMVVGTTSTTTQGWWFPTNAAPIL